MDRTNNFGLNGQYRQLNSDYDNFLCFSKKCKERQAARRKKRLEKKAIRRSSKESVMEDLKTVGVVQPLSTIEGKSKPSSERLATKEAPPIPPQKASLTSSPLLVVGILLVVGGFIYTTFQKGKTSTSMPLPNATQ